jgi:hypothetical protein
VPLLMIPVPPIPPPAIIPPPPLSQEISKKTENSANSNLLKW